MKKTLFISTIMVAVTALSATAQYSQVINGALNTLSPALSGSGRYKGFVEADYTQGLGKYRSNFATITTSQGYQMNDWFFMGAGIGVDLLWSHYNDNWGSHWKPDAPNWDNQSYTSTAVMIPIFTDFRFNIGGWTGPSFFIDVKLGASFLCTNDYVKIRDGYLTNTSYFFLQPALGLRIPVNANNPRQAINIGLHYKLLTSDYWSGYQSSVVLNGLGANISYEW